MEWDAIFEKNNAFCCFLLVPPSLGTGLLFSGCGAQTNTEYSLTPSLPLAWSPPYTKSITEPAIACVPNKGSDLTFSKELSAGASHSSGFCGFFGFFAFYVARKQTLMNPFASKGEFNKIWGQQEKRESLAKADRLPPQIKAFWRSNTIADFQTGGWFLQPLLTSAKMNCKTQNA